jgi:hypothetical protein
MLHPSDLSLPIYKSEFTEADLQVLFISNIPCFKISYPSLFGNIVSFLTCAKENGKIGLPKSCDMEKLNYRYFREAITNNKNLQKKLLNYKELLTAK